MSGRPTVGYGSISVATRDAVGRVGSEKVELRTEVSPGGVPVQVTDEDGREVTVSAKMAGLYADRYAPVAPAKPKGA